MLAKHQYISKASLPRLNYYSALLTALMLSRKTNYFAALMSNKLTAKINTELPPGVKKLKRAQVRVLHYRGPVTITIPSSSLLSLTYLVHWKYKQLDYDVQQ